jgi:hypothetical protein
MRMYGHEYNGVNASARRLQGAGCLQCFGPKARSARKTIKTKEN